MVKGLYTAYTGMVNEQNRMDVLTNNLANFNTTGFKKVGSTSKAFDEELAVRIHDMNREGMKHRVGTLNGGVKIGGHVLVVGHHGNFAGIVSRFRIRGRCLNGVGLGGSGLSLAAAGGQRQHHGKGKNNSENLFHFHKYLSE